MALDTTFKSKRTSEEYVDAGRIDSDIFTPEQNFLTPRSIHELTPSDPMVGPFNNQNWKANMKLKALLSAAAITAFATTAVAADYTKGQVKKIDAKSGKITIKHEELKNLDMPAMTMVFVAKDDDVMSKLVSGKSIEFVAERIKGKLTVTEVK